MKKDNILRLPFFISLFLVLIGIILLVYFVYNYRKNISELERLDFQVEALVEKNQKIEKYGKWTLQYFKIDKALEIMAEKKIPQHIRQNLTERIWQISNTYNIDPLLILAVVSQESRGNPNIRGRYRSGEESGAYGLMQLKLETARTLGKKFGIVLESEEDLMRPDVNVILGTAYLIRLIARYGEVKAALIAYNVGPGKVDRLLSAEKNLPTKYYEGVISKYWGLVSDSIFLDLRQ